MKIKEIMTKKVICLHEDTTVKEAVEIFFKNNISGAPVVDKEDKILGMFTEADIIRMTRTQYKDIKMVFSQQSMYHVDFKEETKIKNLAEAYLEICNKKVSEGMSRQVIFVSPEDLVEEYIHIYVQKGINRIPVVADGKVVGIFTRGDVIKALSRLKKE
ncbi:MAG: CBS domain-containing protein [Thermoplasmata archaeon]